MDVFNQQLRTSSALSTPPLVRQQELGLSPPGDPPQPKFKPLGPPPSPEPEKPATEPPAKVEDTIKALPLGGGYAVACIARRELMRPRYLDEPFTAMDIVLRTGMRNTARNRSNVASSLSNFARPGPQQFLEKVVGSYPATFIRISEPPPEKLRAKPNREPEAIDPAPTPAPAPRPTLTRDEAMKLLENWDDDLPEGTASDLTHAPAAQFQGILDQRLKDETEFLSWVAEEYRKRGALQPPKPLAAYTDDELWDEQQKILAEMARRRRAGK